MRDLIRDLRISVANLDSGDDRSFEFSCLKMRGKYLMIKLSLVLPLR